MHTTGKVCPRAYRCGVAFVMSMGLVGCVDDAARFGQSAQAVVHGEDADITNFPWQILLREGGGGFCGGSILSDRWVLTARHCVGDGMTVTAGITHWSETSSGQRRNVDDYKTHPGNADVAVLHLDSALDLSGAKAKAIQLVDEKAAAAGKTAEGVTTILTGWGDTGNGNGPPDTLQKLAMPIVSQAVAEQYYGSVGDWYLPVSTSGPNGQDQSPCYGDSGGPLVVSDGSNGFLLAGVVSTGQDCSAPAPALYARVSYAAAWIRQNAVQ
jgi:secreted trypsin-like serine protease